MLAEASVWQALGVVVTGLSLLYAVGAGLIKLYFDKSSKLEKLKESIISEKIRELKTETAAHSRSIRSVEKSIDSAKVEIISAIKDIKANNAALHSLKSSLEDFIKQTDMRIKRIEQGEFIKIGDNAWILRTKNGKS